MKSLPVQPLSPEEQQRLMGQMYLLLGKQVKSYHKMRHMGENSSVPVELAQELMASMEYTIELAGGLAGLRDGEKTLRLGQELLEAKAEKAKSLLELVTATAPGWQTECRWDALYCLRQYLANYDPLHLAHKGPEELFYPMLVRVPDGMKGIDLGLFYLNVLWLENQIMAAFADAALEQLWDRLPTDTLNQCEQVVLNGIGKAILSERGSDLVFTEAERNTLQALLSVQPTKETVHHAACGLCRRLDLPENAAAYLVAAAAQLVPRLEAAVKHDNLAVLFL